MIDTAYWTIINHIVIWGSLIVYFLTTWVYNKYIGGKYAGALNNVMYNYSFKSNMFSADYYILLFRDW